MKKNLFVALAVTLLAASCQKTDVLNQLPDAMAFSTEMGKITKAVGTADAAATDVMSNLYAQDFQVWAYTSFTNLNFPTVGAIYDGMEGIFVTRSSETWSTQKQHYWPGMKDATTGNDLKFFAISGQTIATTTDGKTTTTPNGTVTITHQTPVEAKAITSSTLTIEDFTVNHENANTDLMVADFVKQNQTSNNKSKAVKLKFRHTLSKVQFLFKTLALGKDAQGNAMIEHPVYVQSIKVAGINTKATLNVQDVAPTGNDNTWYAPTVAADDNTQIPTYYQWNTLNTPQPFTADYNYNDNDDRPENYKDLSNVANIERLEENVVDNSAMELTIKAEVFDTWLVLPQTIKNDETGEKAIDLKVEVRYVIGTREFKSVFALSTETLDAWAPNQYIKYNVTLAPNLISFNPSVEEWNQYDSDPETTDKDDDVTMQN